MLKFLLKLAIFSIIIVIIDFLSGKFFHYWMDNITTGTVGKENYIAYQSDEDVLIFGSSRADYHYNPRIISDSLGMTCYNCGASGYGIIAAYGRLSMIQKRHHPKIIIYDVTKNFDLLKTDNYNNIGLFKRYYEKNKIKDILNDIDSTEKYKMISQLYRYNSDFLNDPFYIFKPRPTKRLADKDFGFHPQKGEFNKMKLRGIDSNTLDIDDLKLKYIEKFIDISDGSQLFFVASPTWYGLDSLYYSLIIDICKRKNVSWLNFSNNPKYVHNNAFFKDGMHLNDKGADEFTKDFVRALRPLLKQ